MLIQDRLSWQANEATAAQVGIERHVEFRLCSSWYNVLGCTEYQDLIAFIKCSALYLNKGILP